jgi:lambda family phage portal protein
MFAILNAAQSKINQFFSSPAPKTSVENLNNAARLDNLPEAAQGDRRLGAWRPSLSSPNTASLANAAIRSRVYKAYMDMGLAVKGINELTSQYIGTGISARPTTKNVALRDDLLGWWEDFVETSDFYGTYDFYGQQTQAARAWFLGGEGIAQIVPDKSAAIPLKIKLLEVDHLSEKNEQLYGNNQRKIIRGCELDAKGRIDAYWMYPNHPGDYQTLNNQPIRVPANQILRMYKADRPGQLRGTPRLHAALVKMHGLDSFDDAVLERQKIANLFAVFIKRPPKDQSELSERISAFSREMKAAGATDEQIQAALGTAVEAMIDAQTSLDRYAMQPAMMQELGYGEEVQFSTPPGTDANYKDFMTNQMVLLSASIGLPPFMLSGDYRDLSDRAIRDGILNFRRQAEQEIHNVIVHQFVRPVRNAWVDALILSGKLKPRDAAEARRAHYVQDGWHHMHPTQDIQADILAVNNGFTSRAAVALRRGEDVETVDAARAADLAREKAYKIGEFSQGEKMPQATKNHL